MELWGHINSVQTPPSRIADNVLHGRQEPNPAPRHGDTLSQIRSPGCTEARSCKRSGTVQTSRPHQAEHSSAACITQGMGLEAMNPSKHLREAVGTVHPTERGWHPSPGPHQHHRTPWEPPHNTWPGLPRTGWCWPWPTRRPAPPAPVPRRWQQHSSGWFPPGSRVPVWRWWPARSSSLQGTRGCPRRGPGECAARRWRGRPACPASRVPCWAGWCRTCPAARRPTSRQMAIPGRWCPWRAAGPGWPGRPPSRREARWETAPGWRWCRRRPLAPAARPAARQRKPTAARGRRRSPRVRALRCPAKGCARSARPPPWQRLPAAEPQLPGPPGGNFGAVARRGLARPACEWGAEQRHWLSSVSLNRPRRHVRGASGNGGAGGAEGVQEGVGLFCVALRSEGRGL